MFCRRYAPQQRNRSFGTLLCSSRWKYWFGKMQHYNGFLQNLVMSTCENAEKLLTLQLSAIWTIMKLKTQQNCECSVFLAKMTKKKNICNHFRWIKIVFLLKFTIYLIKKNNQFWLITSEHFWILLISLYKEPIVNSFCCETSIKYVCYQWVVKPRLLCWVSHC